MDEQTATRYFITSNHWDRLVPQPKKQGNTLACTRSCFTQGALPP